MRDQTAPLQAPAAASSDTSGWRTARPSRTRDNLLVLYFDDRTRMEQVAARPATLGQLPVDAENPCWTENGAVTVEDPDHWRVVLMPQSLACG